MITYDRRGRGDSGDTPPFAVDREVEDIDALINAFGGSAMLYGLSSGAVLALEAAQRLGDKVTRLAMFEAPFVVGGTRASVPAGYHTRLAQLSTTNRGAVRAAHCLRVRFRKSAACRPCGRRRRL